MTAPNGNPSNPATRLKLLMSWEGFLLAVLCIVFAVNASMSPAFFTVGNQINLFNLSIEKIIVALIMTFIIINGEIDLSVASVMGLSACTFGWLFHAGMPAGLAIVVAGRGENQHPRAFANAELAAPLVVDDRFARR